MMVKINDNNSVLHHIDVIVFHRVDTLKMISERMTNKQKKNENAKERAREREKAAAPDCIIDITTRECIRRGQTISVS